MRIGALGGRHRTKCTVLAADPVAVQDANRLVGKTPTTTGRREEDDDEGAHSKESKERCLPTLQNQNFS